MIRRLTCHFLKGRIPRRSRSIEAKKSVYKAFEGDVLMI